MGITGYKITKCTPSAGDYTLKGEVYVIDSRDAPQTLLFEFEQYDEGAGIDLDLTGPNGEDVMYNDDVEDLSPEDYGLVLTEYKPWLEHRHIPIKGATLFFTERDYTALEDKLNAQLISVLDVALTSAQLAFEEELLGTRELLPHQR